MDFYWDNCFGNLRAHYFWEIHGRFTAHQFSEISRHTQSLLKFTDCFHIHGLEILGIHLHVHGLNHFWNHGLYNWRAKQFWKFTCLNSGFIFGNFSIQGLGSLPVLFTGCMDAFTGWVVLNFMVFNTLNLEHDMD